MRLFRSPSALLALSVISGLSEACSDVRYIRDDLQTDLDPNRTDDAGAADALEADANQGGKTDGAKEDGSDGAIGVCPAPVPLSDPIWKEPPMPRAACTEADLAYLHNISSPGATYRDVELNLRSRSPDCASCIFSDDVDPQWGPLVLVGPVEKGRGIMNMGACFARAPGGSMVCGRTVQQLMSCVEAVCDPELCGDEDKRQACANATALNPNECGRYDVNTACGGPNSYASLVTACRYGFDVIRLMCGGA